MPEAASTRVDGLASRRERRLRFLAQALTAIAAAACLLAVLIAPTAPRIAAALAGAALLVAAAWPARTTRPGRLSVERSGAVRLAGSEADEAAAVVFCGPGFVCLETRAGRLAVFADSLSADSWRRLLVACRWQRRTDPAGGRGVEADSN